MTTLKVDALKAIDQLSALRLESEVLVEQMKYLGMDPQQQNEVNDVIDDAMAACLRVYLTAVGE